MRTFELAETVFAGCGLGLASPLSGALAGVTASCALDDNPTSIRANRAAVLAAEVVFMSASFSIPAGDFFLRRDDWKGGAFPPDFLRAGVTEGMLALLL